MTQIKRISKWKDKNPERWAAIMRKANKKYGRKLRIEALKIIGDKCSICGITDHRCLHLDHINNDGYKDKKNGRRDARAERRWIIKNPVEARKKYQVLCANHNAIKHYEFAYRKYNEGAPIKQHTAC